MRPLEQGQLSGRHSLPGRLPDDAFVMLDPAVEVLEAEIAEHRLLGHGYFEVGMVVPPGEGLLAFVTALMQQPVNLGALRTQFDDQQIIDRMLASLRQHGFMHVTSQAKPSTEELAHFRRIAEQTRGQTLRRPIVIDLDAPISIGRLCDRLSAEAHAPEVLLRCARLADHRRILAGLARLRQAGTVRMHHTAVQTCDLSGDREICRSLIRLGASVHLEGVPWPVPDHPIPGLDEMTRNCVAVHALMTPNLSILDDAVRSRALGWAGSVFISGLRLRLEPEALWPAGNAEEHDFIEIFNAVRAVENEFGDVVIVNLPSDEVLLGNTASSCPPDRLSDFVNRFRASYLRWRLPLLKSCENDNSWSQIPEVEDKLVRAQDDLLPNHPELLLLKAGSVVVDVCGGLGRVARRLSPAVGEDGLIISIEMFRCLSDRARRFACERDFTNLDFRPGLAQRIPLPDATADAAVNEWTGGIWELGLGPTMVREMARVVRPGGRIAVTHRLVRLHLASLGQPWVQYEKIYKWMREAFVHPELTIIAELVWGQIAPSLVGDNASFWRRQYMPRLINPYDVTYKYDDSPGARADVFLTIIAQRQ
jgi:SAM-dependent methyltransferase